MKRTLLLVLLAIACNGDRGRGTSDMSVADLAVADLGSVDGASRCVAQLGPTHLYEDACPTGSGICFIDHPPTDFF